MNFAFIFIPRTIISQVLKIAQDCDSSSLRTSVFNLFASYVYCSGFSQVVLVVKNLPANAGNIRDEGSVSGSRRSPGGGHCNPLQYLPGESHGQRSLVGYSLEDLTESQRQTQLKQLSTAHIRKSIMCHTLY